MRNRGLESIQFNSIRCWKRLIGAVGIELRMPLKVRKLLIRWTPSRYPERINEFIQISPPQPGTAFNFHLVSN
jgi:hypothetical protein